MQTPGDPVPHEARSVHPARFVAKKATKSLPEARCGGNLQAPVFRFDFMSTTQDVLSRRRPRGASDNDAAVGQRPEATESVAAGMPEAFAGAETVGALHEQLGNDVVAAALDGAELDGLGGLVSGSADADV